MSYQVLARKWRPQNFSDVVGQQHVLTALSNGLTLGRLHHAYLFSGTRGVGKTSIARLLAKGLNCETGITATPCGKCDNCRDIEEGRFVDLIEIDAASRTKVEDTRDILDNVQYAPVRGRFKIYLIDEVHMLSRHSFNALLKTLEEPPPHVKFLLATTDPQKLPVTILSRCLQFHLRALDVDLIKQQLEKILTLEHISFEQRGVLLLARAADGSMRDALSLTDQAIASGGGTINDRVVADMLGTLDDEQPLALAEALLNADANNVMLLIEQAAQRSVDWDTLLQEILAVFHQVAMIQLLPIAVDKLQHTHEQKLRDLARRLSPQDLQLYYQIILIGRKELSYAPSYRMGVEMTLLRALAFHPKQSESVLPVSGSPSLLVEKKTVEQIEAVPVLVEIADAHPADKSASAYPIAQDTQLTTAAASIDSVTEAESVTFSETTDNILQARNKLMQRQQVEQQKKNESATLSNSVIAPVSVLERLVNATEQRPGSHKKDIDKKKHKAEAYQWKAQRTQSLDAESTATPKAIRSTLEFEKTPQLAAKLTEEAIKRDLWAAEIDQLALPKLVQQLALNASKQQIGDNEICLHLRSSQRHLNTVAAQQLLSEALSKLMGKTIILSIIEDNDSTVLTPIEWRQLIYDEMLSQAKQAVIDDNNIQAICRLFNAELDTESIRPV